MTLDLATDSAVEALLAPFPVRTARNERGVFSFREAGTGPAVVLLHGIGSGSGSWARQLASLGKRYRVVAWDAPGYGESSPLAGSPQAADYAAALGEFLDAIGVRRAGIVGHSLGALMAAAFARRYPQRADRLILASPAGGYARASGEERERRLHERQTAFRELAVAERARRLLGPAPRAEDVALVEWNLRRLRAAGYAQAGRMLADGNIRADLASWSRPLLVISGSADAVTPEATCRAIAAAAQYGRYCRIDGAGHVVYIEAHATFDAAVVAHLEGEP